LPDIFHAIFFFLEGIVFGSFANVMIVRIPDGDNIAWPGSHCRQCKKKVAWHDNIPLLSWLILRGKCRYCKAEFSIQYFFVELIMGVLFTLAYFKLGYSWFLLEFLIFTLFAVTASFIDLKHFILPDVFTLGGLGIALIGALANPERSFVDASIGVLVGGGFFYLVAYVYYIVRKQEGMGGGDIKLLAWIGALLGWQAIGFVVFFSGFVGAAFGLLRGALKKGDMKSPIPFGPFLVAGALAYVLGAQTIVQWYMEIIGLR
jgi:leader peptidase (prepilin peptidase)/N-methyltransferase